jgi:DNA-binding LacI/PurR family transcriptional regulator
MLKYQQLKKRLKEDMIGADAEERLPPIRIMIKKYNTSLSTINRALDELENENVIIRKRGSGIFPLKKQGGKDDSVGVLLHSLETRFYSLILNGITSELLRRGVSVRLHLLSSGGEPITPNYEEMMSHSCLMVVPTTSDIYERSLIDGLRQVAESGTRIVGLDIPVPGLSCDFIGLENENAFKSGVEKLLGLGFRRIFVAGNLGSYVFPNRQAGIRKACGASGVSQPRLFDTNSISAAGEIVNAYLESGCDTIVCADANWSESLVSYALGGELEHVGMLCVVEPDTVLLPSGNIVLLEKPSFQLGVEAARIHLEGKSDESGNQVRILSMESLAS